MTTTRIPQHLGAMPTPHVDPADPVHPAPGDPMPQTPDPEQEPDPDPEPDPFGLP